jgi:hypothetical protein
MVISYCLLLLFLLQLWTEGDVGIGMDGADVEGSLEGGGKLVDGVARKVCLLCSLQHLCP